MCERTGPSLCGTAGLSRRILSKRKRHSGVVWGILLQQQLQSHLQPATQCSQGGVGIVEPKSEESGRVHPHGGLRLHPMQWGVPSLAGPETTGTGESTHHRRPLVCTHNPEEDDCLNLWVQGLLGSWARGCPCAGWEERRAGLGPLSWLQPKRPAKLVTSLKSADLFFFIS